MRVCFLYNVPFKLTVDHGRHLASFPPSQGALRASGASAALGSIPLFLPLLPRLPHPSPARSFRIPGGSLFAISRERCYGFRADGWAWKHRGVRGKWVIHENHMVLRVDGCKVIRCCYGYPRKPGNALHRRIYWLAEFGRRSVVLVHYLDLALVEICDREVPRTSTAKDWSTRRQTRSDTAKRLTLALRSAPNEVETQNRDSVSDSEGECALVDCDEESRFEETETSCESEKSARLEVAEATTNQTRPQPFRSHPDQSSSSSERGACVEGSEVPSCDPALEARGLGQPANDRAESWTHTAAAPPQPGLVQDSSSPQFTWMFDNPGASPPWPLAAQHPRLPPLCLVSRVDHAGGPSAAAPQSISARMSDVSHVSSAVVPSMCLLLPVQSVLAAVHQCAIVGAGLSAASPSLQAWSSGPFVASQDASVASAPLLQPQLPIVTLSLGQLPAQLTPTWPPPQGAMLLTLPPSPPGQGVPLPSVGVSPTAMQACQGASTTLTCQAPDLPLPMPGAGADVEPLAPRSPPPALDSGNVTFAQGGIAAELVAPSASAVPSVEVLQPQVSSIGLFASDTCANRPGEDGPFDLAVPPEALSPTPLDLIDYLDLPLMPPEAPTA